eukprot:12295737-Karenia_brevis.AAC.1
MTPSIVSWFGKRPQSDLDKDFDVIGRATAAAIAHEHLRSEPKGPLAFSLTCVYLGLPSTR